MLGLTADDAKSQLEGAGFKVKTVERASNEVAKGNVIDQSPTPGSKVQPGTTITLTVSTGPEQQQTPNDQPSDWFPTDDPGNGGDPGGDMGDPGGDDGGIELPDGDNPFGN